MLKMLKKISQLGEFGLINLIRRQVDVRRPGIKGIGDDTAVLPCPKDKSLLFTTDMIVEGVHFTKNTAPQLIGRKAMASNLSDIAAMGGLPIYAVVSLGISPKVSVDYVNKIYEGMNRIGKKFGVAIVGGDTVKSDKLIINIALLGEAKHKKIIFRSGAKSGDQIFVTGPLGRSLPTGKHFNFLPRIAQSQYLIKNFAPTSMIDISDGLAADLGHILEESRVGAVIYEDKIPRNSGANLDNALYDGEDFELIFTLSLGQAKKLSKTKHKRFRFFCIGEITSNLKKLWLVDQTGQKKLIPFSGYKHF